MNNNTCLSENEKRQNFRSYVKPTLNEIGQGFRKIKNTYYLNYMPIFRRSKMRQISVKMPRCDLQFKCSVCQEHFPAFLAA